MSPAEFGVWFNGDEHAYIRKLLHADGSRTWQDLPDIPRRGQRVEDIGLFKRRDLTPPSNLKAVFRDIRNHLAGSTTGITPDEILAQEIINLLFCKIYDEINTGLDEIVEFRTGFEESAADVKARIVTLFAEVKDEYADVFDPSDEIRLDAASIVYVVGELQNYSVTSADRDAIGDAFEVFIGPALRGSEGQFFTPRNVVRMMVDIVDPRPGELILDPACGSGGFLIIALERVWQKLEDEAARKGWTDVALDRKKRDAATRFFRGIDKDTFLAKVTKAYMAIVGDGRGGVFCDNSLLPGPEMNPKTREAVGLESADVILTNPPFGKNIKIRGENILHQFQLAAKWKRKKGSDDFTETKGRYSDRPPQILFIERCLQFLKPGGRLGIVLPEAIFGMPTHAYVVAYLRQRVRICGIVSMPEALFKTSGKGGTHAKVCVVFLEKNLPIDDDYEIFMAECKWCGHDSRGNPTVRIDEEGHEILLDDIPHVAEMHHELVGTW
jgi:type I restriction enzyme M protein